MAKIETRLDTINAKLNALATIEASLQTIIKKEDKELKEIEKEEGDIEQTLVKLGNFTIKRSHVLELARGTAGAFLGVGLGQILGVSLKLAAKLHWTNIFGILIFVFLLSGLLIYKNDKAFIDTSREQPFVYIIKKISVLYSISLAVVFIAMILFNNFPGWNSLLVKALFVGSFPAMSSAAAFSII